MNAIDRRFTINLPNGEIRRPLDFGDLCGVLRELGRDEREARRTLLAHRLALGAALLQAERQVPRVRIIEMYERAGISRKVGAACKRKAAHLADEAGRLDADRVRTVQATIAADQRPEQGSRLDKLVRLEPERLSDSAADELVGNRPLRAGHRIPFANSAAPVKPPMGVPFSRPAALGSPGPASPSRVSDDQEPATDGEPVSDGHRTAGVCGRQMSLAEHVAELADAAVREVTALRERGDATARAALEAMLEAAKGVALV